MSLETFDQWLKKYNPYEEDSDLFYSADALSNNELMNNIVTISNDNNHEYQSFCERVLILMLDDAWRHNGWDAVPPLADRILETVHSDKAKDAARFYKQVCGLPLQWRQRAVLDDDIALTKQKMRNSR